MSEQTFRYHHRGVSASKDEVHQAIESLDKGIFPNAFCKILPDLTSFDPAWCNVMHADTAGTKTSLAYMYWKETGDLDVWKGIVEDALVMNTDDMACVGCIDNIILSSTIGRNKHLISGEVIKTIIQHAQYFIEKMASLGIHMYLAGGETADVGDIVRTIDVGYTTFCRIPRSQVVDINIQEGDWIVGFSSYGQATYENTYNGGLGSNGLTSARHDVFHSEYREKYPESFSAEMNKDYAYTGSYRLTDSIEIEGKSMTIGKLVLSPTRTYMPLIKKILDECRDNLNGLIHCSGGGQTKVSKFIQNKVRIVKNNLLPVPPLFDLIKKESGATWEEMYKVFNMGHRLEAYTSSEKDAQKMIELAGKYNIDAQIIGKVEYSETPGVTIQTEDYTITY
jgi:phosphoribosylformylglycinamidine cyclo-ligase